jgi:hypothetical protein
MRKSMNWIVAASLGVAGTAFLGCDRNGTSQASKDTNPAADTKVINNKNDAASVAGSKIPGDQIGTVDLGNIYGTLADTADYALTKGDFKKLTEELSMPDRERFGKFVDQKFDDFDSRADQLSNDYKGKFNTSFKLDKNKVFENWAQVQKTGQDSDETTAKVMVPAGHGLPALTIPIVKQHEAWRIDIPDSVTGDQLKQSVQDHLAAIDNMKDQWPSDQLEAQRAIIHHVLMAVMNMPMAK